MRANEKPETLARLLTTALAISWWICASQSSGESCMSRRTRPIRWASSVRRVRALPVHRSSFECGRHPAEALSRWRCAGRIGFLECIPRFTLARGAFGNPSPVRDRAPRRETAPAGARLPVPEPVLAVRPRPSGLPDARALRGICLISSCAARPAAALSALGCAIASDSAVCCGGSSRLLRADSLIGSTGTTRCASSDGTFRQGLMADAPGDAGREHEPGRRPEADDPALPPRRAVAVHRARGFAEHGPIEPPRRLIARQPAIQIADAATAFVEQLVELAFGIARGHVANLARMRASA